METLSDKRVKARKEHTCDFCGKKIVKGEEYRRSTHVYEGQIYDWHGCDRCKKYVSMAFKEYGDLAGDGLTEQDFRDYMWGNHREAAEVWWR